jgi:hypothetical protein
LPQKPGAKPWAGKNDEEETIQTRGHESGDRKDSFYLAMEMILEVLDEILDHGFPLAVDERAVAVANVCRNCAGSLVRQTRFAGTRTDRSR